MLKHHKTIKTLPLHNWRESSNDVRWCRVGFDDLEENTRIKKEDYKAHEALQEDYVFYFGMSDETLQLHRLQKKLLIARVDAMTSLIYMNEVYRIEHLIQELLSGIKTRSTNEIENQLIDIETWRRLEIDPYKTTVYKFKLIVEKFNKHCADQRKALEKYKR